MEERTESRPAQESTFWEQIKEQQPPTVETEAQIHFDEGASVSFETRTDRSHVDIVQTELQENPQEQPVDIPPGPSGIQHSTSLSQVIEAAVHPQPSTPTNEHSTSLSQEIEAAVQPQPSTPTNEHSTSLSQEIEAAVQPQPSTPTNEHSTSLSQEIEAAVHPQPATPTNETVTLETIEDQQPTYVTTEAEVHFGESGRVSFRPGTLRCRNDSEQQTNQRPSSNIIEPAPGPSGMQYLSPSPSLQPTAISVPTSPCVSWLNLDAKEPNSSDDLYNLFVCCVTILILVVVPHLLLILVIVDYIVTCYDSAVDFTCSESTRKWFNIGCPIYYISITFLAYLVFRLLSSNPCYQCCRRNVIRMITCCCRNRKHEEQNINDQIPKPIPKICITNEAETRVRFRNS